MARGEERAQHRQGAQPRPRHCGGALVHQARRRHGVQRNELEVAGPRHSEVLVHDHLVQQLLHILLLCVRSVVQPIAGVALKRP